MARKPMTLRTTVIFTSALAGGSVAADISHAVVVHLGYVLPGLDGLAAALVGLWIMDKLDNLVEQSK